MGRSSRLAIVLTDPYVSRRQAQIVRHPDDTAFLVDLSKRATTTVNGEAHERGALWFGDKIQMGNTTLLVTPQDATEGLKLEQDRIQALGYLTSGIAHDFNNMLGVILSTLSYLRALPEDTTLGSDDVLECLDDVFRAGERSAQLVQRILLFARREKESHEELDLGELCREVLALAGRGFPKNIVIESTIGEGLWVRGARAQLAQLVMNLCINARDAMPLGGVLRVDADAQDSDVRLLVSDSGVGMSEETRSRIFERFFTTKDRDGTGLGLATVVEVARWHGGVVNVMSELGEGTSFEVRLPLRDPKRTRANSPTKMIDRRTSTGRILIIDDDPMVRRSLVRLLQQWGHETIDVGDPREAVAIYQEKMPDLVLLDLDMPGMDGHETWYDLRAADPDVAVAFVSGHSAADWERRLLAEGALGFLQKPFEVSELKDFVRTALTFPSVPPQNA